MRRIGSPTGWLLVTALMVFGLSSAMAQVGITYSPNPPKVETSYGTDAPDLSLTIALAGSRAGGETGDTITIADVGWQGAAPTGGAGPYILLAPGNVVFNKDGDGNWSAVGVQPTIQFPGTGAIDNGGTYVYRYTLTDTDGTAINMDVTIEYTRPRIQTPSAPADRNVYCVAGSDGFTSTGGANPGDGNAEYKFTIQNLDPTSGSTLKYHFEVYYTTDSVENSSPPTNISGGTTEWVNISPASGTWTTGTNEDPTEVVVTFDTDQLPDRRTIPKDPPNGNPITDPPSEYNYQAWVHIVNEDDENDGVPFTFRFDLRAKSGNIRVYNPNPEVMGRVYAAEGENPVRADGSTPVYQLYVYNSDDPNKTDVNSRKASSGDYFTYDNHGVQTATQIDLDKDGDPVYGKINATVTSSEPWFTMPASTGSIYYFYTTTANTYDPGINALNPVRPSNAETIASVLSGSFDTTSLSPGTYTSTITLADPYATNQEITKNIVCVVGNPQISLNVTSQATNALVNNRPGKDADETQYDDSIEIFAGWAGDGSTFTGPIAGDPTDKDTETEYQGPTSFVVTNNGDGPLRYKITTSYVDAKTGWITNAAELAAEKILLYRDATHTNDDAPETFMYSQRHDLDINTDTENFDTGTYRAVLTVESTNVNPCESKQILVVLRVGPKILVADDPDFDATADQSNPASGYYGKLHRAEANGTPVTSTNLKVGVPTIKVKCGVGESPDPCRFSFMLPGRTSPGINPLSGDSWDTYPTFCPSIKGNAYFKAKGYSASQNSNNLNFTLQRGGYASGTWMRLDTEEGTLEPNDQSNVKVTFDTSSLPEGNYTGYVYIYGSNFLGEDVANDNFTFTDPSNPTLTPDPLGDCNYVKIDLELTKPTIKVDPGSLNYTLTQGTTGSKTFTVCNRYEWGTLYYSLTPIYSSETTGWLSVSDDDNEHSSTGPGEQNTITVNFDASGLDVGTYDANVRVASNNASNSPVDVPISLQVIGSELALEPTELTPSCATGQSPSDYKSFQVWNGGTPSTTLNFSVSASSAGNWLGVTPASGTSTGIGDKKTITVNYFTSAMSTGTYSGTITVTNTDNNRTRTVNVTLTLIGPAIATNKAIFEFSREFGQAVAATRNFNLWNSKSLTNSILNFTIGTDQEWMTVSPNSGTSTGPADPKAITVTFDTVDLTAGLHEGKIVITDDNADNTPFEIPVKLTIETPTMEANTPADTQYGANCNLTWNSNAHGTVKIELYKGAVATPALVITESTDNDAGAYTWVVPGSLTAGNDYKIRVVSNTDTSVADTCDAFFAIAEADYLVVEQPVGGETWVAGLDYDIKWSSNAGGTAALAYQRDGVPAVWTPIAAAETNPADGSTASYSWTVPANIDNYLIKVTGSTGVVGQSPAKFAVQAANVTVTAPDGGEKWALGSTQNVTWTSNIPATNKVDIKLSTNGVGGPFGTTLATNEDNDGTYSWTINDALGVQANCAIQVTETATLVSDVSNAVFELEAKSIDVTAPVGGTQNTGATCSITWTTNFTGNVKIELLNDGAKALTISSNTENDGAFDWDVPINLAAGDKYAIKITEVDGTTTDTGTNFTINKVDAFVVTSPNGGEKWATGTNRTITWLNNIQGTWTDVGALADLDASTKALYLAGDKTANFKAKNLIRVEGYTDFLTVVSDSYNASSGLTTVTVSELLPADLKPGPMVTVSSNYAVAIDLYSNNGGTWVRSITSCTPNDGTYTWAIPSDLAEATNYRVKVTYIANTKTDDMSDADFAIGSSSLSITSPTEGLSWAIGSTQAITWNSTIGGTVSVAVYKADVKLYDLTTLTSNEGYSNSYSWTVGADLEPDADYKIQVSSNNTTLSVFSGQFTVEPGSYLIVTTPQAGARWRINSTQTITWDSSLSSAQKVNLFYSSDSGENWTSIANNEDNDGSYTWDTSGLVSAATYRIRIVSVTFDTINNSTGDFSLEPQAYTVDYPGAVADDSLFVGGSYNLQWTAPNDNTVSLSLLRGMMEIVDVASGTGGSFTLAGDQTSTIKVMEYDIYEADHNTEILTVQGNNARDFFKGVKFRVVDTGVSSHEIKAIDTSSKTFQISGDQTVEFYNGATFDVVESSENDGTYTVSGAPTYDSSSDRTSIVVVEAIPGATVEGEIERDTNINGLYTASVDATYDDSTKLTSITVAEGLDSSTKAGKISLGTTFVVSGDLNSSSNDAVYTASSVSSVGGNTEVAIDPSESILSSTAGGYVSKLDSVITTSNASSTGANTYSWAIPAEQPDAEDYFLKVTSTLDESLFGVSENAFEIIRGSITVKSPNGGDNWTSGEDNLIRWSSYGFSGDVKIELLNNGELDPQTPVIVPSTANDGSFTWPIPEHQNNGSSYKVRISSVNVDTITDSSDGDFSISGTQLVITAPNGGENWALGTRHVITWDKSVGTETKFVRINLLKEGDFYQQIASGEKNDGMFYWNLPSDQSMLGASYKIQIIREDDATISDTSDSTFRMGGGYLTLTKPNGVSKFNTVFSDELNLSSNDVKFGDFDDDGDEDVFVANGANQPNYVFINNGDRTFSDSGQRLGNSNSNAVALGDVNGDGFIDAVVANGAGNLNRIWLNDGDGNFSLGLTIGGGEESLDIVLRDLDGKNGLDVVIANNEYLSGIYMNNGSGVFTQSQELRANARGVDVADLNNDGALDIVLVGYDGYYDYWNKYGFVQVYLQKVTAGGEGEKPKPTGEFLEQENTFIAYKKVFSSVALADLNGDNLPDAFVTVEDQDTYSWYYKDYSNYVLFNSGTPNTGVFNDSYQSLGSSQSFDVILQDFDSDGNTDAFVSNNGANTTWLNSSGNGLLTDSGQRYGEAASRGMDYADSTGDNSPDIFVANYGEPNVMYELNPEVENWGIGTKQRIEWLANVGESIRIELGRWSGDEFNYDSTIVSSVVSDNGYYEWTIPVDQEPAANYRVRITSSNGYTDTSDGNFVISYSSYLVLSKPNGGETVERDGDYDIVWESNIGGTIKLEYSIDDGENWTEIVSGVDSSVEQYTWDTVPDQNVDGTALVKITSVRDPSISDQSDSGFSIKSPYIEVTAPTGDEDIWNQMKTYDITWNSNVDENVRIELYKDGVKVTGKTTGLPDSATGTGTENDGLYKWTIPKDDSDPTKNLTPGDGYSLMISSIPSGGGASVSAESGDFEITAAVPFIELTSPIGLEKWALGSKHDITWRSYIDDGAKVNIALYKGGVFVKTVVAGTENKGTYRWTIPEYDELLADGDYTMRVSDASNDLTADVSDPFELLDPSVTKPITLITPAGGDSWSLGAQKKIEWTSTVGGTVKIDLFRYYNKMIYLNGSTIYIAGDHTGKFFDNDQIIVTGSTDKDGNYTIASSGVTLDQRLISEVFQSERIFSIVGKQYVSEFYPNGKSGQQLVVFGSEGNDGNYTVSEAYYEKRGDTEFTNIVVTEPIPSINKGGNILRTFIKVNETFYNSLVDGYVAKFYKNITPSQDSSSFESDSPNVYNWYIPESLPGARDYGVKITSNTNSTWTDASKSNIEILPGAYIIVTYPNGGESWALTNEYNITWDTNTGGSVYIDYSNNQGSTWRGIVNDPAAPDPYLITNEGYFKWTPSSSGVGVGNQYRIRVRSSADVNVGDESDANFSIENPFIQITSPNGEEQWARGVTHEITWDTNIPGENVDVLLSSDGGTTFTTLASAVDNTGVYDWLIPANQTAGTNYVILIQQSDDPSVFDESDNAFEITSQLVISVTSPNGDEKWALGAVRYITWETNITGTNPKVRIDLYKGNEWLMEVTDPKEGTENDGSYKWTIQSALYLEAGDNYSIKLTSIEYSLVSDESDNYFALEDPDVSNPITVTSPNGGENWQVGTLHEIAWQSTAGGSVKVQLGNYDEENGWYLYDTLSSNVDNSAASSSYNWTVSPDIPARVDYRMRVVSNLNGQWQDISNQDFAISEGSYMVITAPNGGEVLPKASGDSKTNINWQSNAGGNVKLYYSTDSGTQWTEITATEVANGTSNTYAWDTSALAIGENYRVKIVSVTDGVVNDAISDTSDADFAISTGYITLIQPNGGVDLVLWDSYQVLWDTFGTTGDVSVELYQDNEKKSDITLVDGYWDIDPNTYKAGDNYKVKVTATTTVGALQVSDMSDNVFSLVYPTMTVTAPNGGENWGPGKSYKIKWTSNSANTVDIFYWDDKNGTWTVLASNYANTGVYTWSIPDDQPLGTKYLVKVKLSNSSLQDQSDDPFTIGGSSAFQVVSPNGGEYWSLSDSVKGFSAQRSINWICTIPGNVNLDLYKSGEKLMTIASNIANTGTHVWTIPQYNDPASPPTSLNIGDDYRIRVSSTISDDYDFSDENFQLAPGYLTVTSPDGGETWAKDRQTITWDSNLRDLVFIDLYKNVSTDIIRIYGEDSALYPTRYVVLPGDMSNDYATKRRMIIKEATTDWVNGTYDIIGVSFDGENTHVQVTPWSGVGFIAPEKCESEGKSYVSYAITGAVGVRDDTNTYEWDVNRLIPNSDNYMVRIRTDLDTGPGEVKFSDASDANFTIGLEEGEAPYITVVSPDSSDHWAIGTTHDITWETNVGGKFQIELYSGSELVTGSNLPIGPVVENVPDANGRDSYSWSIPSDLTVSENYMIRVSNYDNEVIGVSDSFTIAEDFIDLTAPNGGEVWPVGGTKRITWYSNINDTLEIDLYDESGTWVREIASAIANSGEYYWSIPADLPIADENGETLYYKIRVANTTDENVYGQSDDAFSFAYLTVTAPSGGERWALGSTHNIKWETNVLTTDDKVRIELKRNGIFQRTIAEVKNSGSYSWSVPTDLSPSPFPVPPAPMIYDYSIKIVSMNNALYSGKSASSFRLDDNKYILVEAPDGGENWYYGAKQQLSWQSNLGGTVKVELGHMDGGGTWTTDLEIADGVSNDGYATTMDWVIPTTIQARNDYRIKVTSSLDTTWYDISDYPFTISPDSYIVVTTPPAGASLATNVEYEIKWEANVGGTVAIELYKNSKIVATSGLPNSVDSTTGSYKWTPPNTLIDGDDYLLKIVSNVDSKIYGESTGLFSIKSAYVSVTYPNGGADEAALTRSKDYTVTWESNVGGNVKIDLWKAGVFQETIISSTENNGSYLWHIRSDMPVGTDYRVVITSLLVATATDSSENDFEINDASYIDISAPDGGEHWAIGSSWDVTWSTNIEGDVRLDLFKGGTWVSEIVASTANDGSYTWSIPSALTADTDYKIKISSIQQSLIFDESADVFALEDPTITLTAPNGGETYSWGQNVSIYWTSNAGGNVKIELLKGGTVVETIADSADNTAYSNSYSWLVQPERATGTDYKVRITSLADSGLSAESADFFSIVPGTYLMLTAPNGGETWLAGEENTITWKSNAGGKVLLQYSSNSGASWTNIPNATELDNSETTGEFKWDLKLVDETYLTIGTTYRINVVSTSEPSLKDSSDADFSVAPTIAVTSPNGGEEWVPGNTYDITWTSSGVPGAVDIALYKGGNLDSSIYTDPTNSGTYSWTIPLTQGGGADFKVRVTCADETSFYDESDENFTITREPVPIADPDSLSLSCGTGESTSSSFQLSNTGLDTLTYSISTSTDDGAAWLSVPDDQKTGTLASGADPVTITVNGDATALGTGTYTGKVTIADTVFTSISKEVAVTFTVASNSIAVSESLGEPPVLRMAGNVDSQTSSDVQVWNAGSGVLNFTASTTETWISLSGDTDSSSTGTADPKTVTVTCDATGLTAGTTYEGTVTIQDKVDSGNKLDIAVKFAVSCPAITLTKNGEEITALDEDFEEGDTTTDQFTIANSGYGTLNFQFTITYPDEDPNKAWLSEVSPASGQIVAGSDAVPVTLTFNIDDLDSGTYTATLTVADSALPTVESKDIAITMIVTKLIPDAGSLLAKLSDRMTRNTNNRVSFWQDLTGSGNNARQINERSQPLMKEDAIGSYPSIKFDGKTSLLINGLRANDAFKTIQDKPRSLALILKTGDVDNRHVILAQGDDDNGLNMYVEGGKLYACAWNYTTASWGPAYASWDVVSGNLYYIFMILDPDSNEMTLYVNQGTDPQVATIGQLDFSTTEVIVIGNQGKKTMFIDRGRADGFDGELAELLYYDKVLSADEIIDLVTYVNNKYTLDKYNADIRTTDLGAWFRADTGIDKKKTELSEWLCKTDMTNKGPELRQGNRSNPAFVRQEALNSCPGVAFDGLGAYMKAKNADGINRGDFPDKTIYVVFKANDVDSQQIIWTQGNKKSGLNIYLDSGAITMGAWELKKSNWFKFVSGGTLEAETGYCATLVLDGGGKTLTGYLNGTQIGQETGAGQLYKHSYGVMGAVQRDTLISGGDIIKKGYFFNGEVMEIIMYNATLSDEENAQIESYLNVRYGIVFPSTSSVVSEEE